MLEGIKSLLLRLGLGAYNGAILIIINPLMASYGLWNERRWTKARGVPASDAAPSELMTARSAEASPSAPPRS